MPEENEPDLKPVPGPPPGGELGDGADAEVQRAIEQEARTMIASVSLPEKGSIPEDKKLEVIERVNVLRNKHRITYAVLVKQLGGKEVNTSVLSLVLNRKYSASDDDVIRRLNAWVEATERRIAARRPAGICDTGIVRVGRSACEYAKAQNKIVLMTGPSGIGKTVMARVYCTEDMNAVYVRLKATHASPTGFLRLLAELALRIECTLPQDGAGRGHPRTAQGIKPPADHR